MKWLLLIDAGVVSAIISAFYVTRKKTSVEVHADPTAPESKTEKAPDLPPEPLFPATLPPNPTPMPTQPKPADFSTPKAAWHSVRVICDEMGLPLTKSVVVNSIYHLPKDIICACIFQESRFNNHAQGTNAHSTDWGICQINDKIWAGPGEPFSSAQDIVDHPEKAVRFMVDKYQHGKLSLWVSYSSGAYKEWLVPNSPMWELSA